MPSNRRFVEASAPLWAKSLEGVFRDADDVVGNERSSFGSAILGMLQRTLPLEHRPARIVVLRHLGEDGGEIHMAVTEGAETAGPVHPRLIATVDARPTGGG